MQARRVKTPEFFSTNIRKVEPIGGDCVRIYCSIERNGTWEDRGIMEMPIAMALTSARFLIASATAIFEESQIAAEGLRVH
jgi:hypothetical protein